MDPNLENKIEQLRGIILTANEGELPNWIELPHQSFEKHSIRAGIAKLLKWLRAMSTSKKIRDLRITDQPWGQVVMAIADGASFIVLDRKRHLISLDNELSRDEQLLLCEVAENEFRPRIMSDPFRKPGSIAR